MSYRKRHYQDPDEDLRDLFARIAATIALLYGLSLLFNLYSNRAEFWKLAGYGLAVVVVLLGALFAWRKVQEKLRRRKVHSLMANVQQSGQEEYILNFINRFGMEGSSTRGWSFRNYHFDWNRISDLEKVLSERGMRLNLNEGERDVFTLLRLFIQRKEEALTRGSIQQTPHHLAQLSGTDFENLLNRLFTAMGYQVQHIGKTGDQGGDLIANANGDRILIQAKCYRDWSVGNAAVQQAVAAMKYYDCNKTMVVTTSDAFTREAVDLAKAHGTELISKARLSELLLTYLQESWN
jgi:HJR/Mrr/RecB family endonuclease